MNMKSKKKLLIASSLSCACLATLVAIGGTGGKEASFVKGNTSNYSMSLSSERNKLHAKAGNVAYDGEAALKTDLGNEVSFSYYQVKGTASTWQVLGDGGYFYNVDPIHGLKSISLSFKTDNLAYQILYSKDDSFDRSKELTSAKDSPASFDFNGYLPNHFKILNKGGANLNISAVEIEYSCLNNYPSLSLRSEDEAMGSVSGPSLMVAGEQVTIEATPKQGYKFVGWYSGEDLVSQSAAYTFTCGNEDLSYAARFTYESYNLLVRSEDAEKGSVSSSSGAYAYLTPITLSARAEEGYTFKGWYAGNALVSSSNPYSFTMPYGDLSYTAKFATNSYALNLNNANPDLGKISGAGTFPYKNSVTLSATPNVGVSFLGWYDKSGTLISSSKEYTFKMPHEDLEYTAKFAWTPYEVALSVNDSSMGSVSGGGSYLYQQEVSLAATPKEHHSFAGWYLSDELVSTNNPFVFLLPNKSLRYEAKFVKNYALNVSSEDEEKGDVTSPSEYGEGLEVTISAAPKEGWAFAYWYDDDLNEVSYVQNYTFTMPGHEVSLYASFAKGYALSLTSSDEGKGTVSGGGEYIEGRTVTVSMNYLSGTFKGWYDGEGNFLSKENPYTFSMPSHDLALEAKFMTKAEEEEEEARRRALGIDPVIDPSSNTLTYGLYPQKHVSDGDLIASLDGLASPEGNGWYLLDGSYYAKRTARPYNSDYSFDDGAEIVYGKDYWFKCEPITWRILSSSSGEYSLVSTLLLDAHCYYSSLSSRTIDGKTVYPNNYEHSDIRAWLNGDFYSSAFSLGDSNILAAAVGNSASTTDSGSNPYACSDTLDKVCLLSYQDYMNAAYFADDSARQCRTTDWARACGAYGYTGSSDLYNNGWYWTRSPHSSNSRSAWGVRYSGYLYAYNVYYSSSSVRPSLRIKVAQ